MASGPLERAVTPRPLELCPNVRGIPRFGGQDCYSPRYQWKHRYSQALRWFRETGFSDLCVAGEPICVRGLKVSAL
jgi:hypothetical protein